MACLAHQLGLRIPRLCLLRLKLQEGHHTYLTFTWVLKSQIAALMFGRLCKASSSPATEAGGLDLEDAVAGCWLGRMLLKRMARLPFSRSKKLHFLYGSSGTSAH